MNLFFVQNRTVINERQVHFRSVLATHPIELGHTTSEQRCELAPWHKARRGAAVILSSFCSLQLGYFTVDS